MEFVTASTAGWDDPWVLSLDLEHHQVWHYLIYGPDFANGHSFAERNPVMWPIRMKLPMVRIDEILADFVADGKVKIQGEIVWAIRGIYHQRLGIKGNNLKNALDKIRIQYSNKAPDLVNDVHAMYDSDGVVTGYNGGGLNRTEQIISKQIKTEQINSDSDEPPVDVQLRELESGLSPKLLDNWKAFKAMCAEKRKSGRVAASVLLGHLKPILASQLSEDAICYGFQQACKCPADNHNYVLTAARNHGNQRKPDDEPRIERRPGYELASDGTVIFDD